MTTHIIGSGSYLPERILTNGELATTVDTSDEWIASRTGIRQRHIAADGEMTSDLAFNASLNALDSAGIKANDIDLIIVATTTPDHTFPSVATSVQAKLGITRGAAFDIQAVCSGFIYALSVADNMIRGGQAETALVIGAETFSRIIDWTDRSTCVLFGDGAGAVVLRAGKDAANKPKRGILSTHLHSDGRLENLLFTDGGPSSTKTSGHVKILGRQVFKHAVTKLSEVVEEALSANSMDCSEIDWLIPHQANLRIIEHTAKKLGIEKDRTVVTVDKHANTSSASVPLALDTAVRDGRVHSGDLIVMEAIGGGMTWGACIVRW